MDTAVGQLTVRVPGNPGQRVGERVHLRWQAENAHVFDAKTDLRVA